MALPTCINNPKDDQILVLRKWQIKICDGNKCAAAILSFLIYFHDVKTEIAKKNKQQNDIAEQHGEERSHDEGLLQFHSIDELSERILQLYKRNSVIDAVKILERKGIISTHRNPNPRFKFDKTTYYRLYPEVCNNWLAKNHDASKTCLSDNKQNTIIALQDLETRWFKNQQSVHEKETLDSLEINNRGFETKLPQFKNQPAITKKTYIDTDRQTDSDAQICDFAFKRLEKLLKNGGIPQKWLENQQDREFISSLVKSKISESVITKALNIASNAKQGRPFGVNYLRPILQDLLLQKFSATNDLDSDTTCPQPHTEYITDLSNAGWAHEE